MPIAAFADSYTGGNTIIIDTPPGTSLQASVEAALGGDPASNITHFTIQDGVVYTLTGADIDYINTALTAITHLSIGNATLFNYNGDGTLGDVGDSFLYDNDVIQNIRLVNAITFGINAFSRCDVLTDVDLPSATTFGDDAFEEADGLISISLPVARTFGIETFMGCSFLTTVNLPLAESFGTYSFYQCDDLTTVTLPSATTFGNSAFEACPDLVSIRLPSAVTFGDYPFAFSDALTTVDLPNATTFGGRAFRGSDAIQTVHLPAATTFGVDAFMACTALTAVNLPSATTFGDRAFRDCDALRTVNLPSATTFGVDTFIDSAGPVSLTLGNSIPPATGTTFGAVPATTNSTVFVPIDRLNAYLAVNDGDTSDQLWWGWLAVGYNPASSPANRVENPKTGDFDYGLRHIAPFILLIMCTIAMILFIRRRQTS